MKNPMTPATFRFVAQHLNHCATAVPPDRKVARKTGHGAQSFLQGLGKKRSSHYYIYVTNQQMYSDTTCLLSCLGVVHIFNIFLCIACIVFNCLVCIVVVVVCVLLSSYVYLLYYMCIAVFTLDTGLRVRSQYSEGLATGHLDTGFSWFPCVYKQLLRWFPRFQVATTCFSCGPPDLNLLVTNFIFCIHVK